MASGRDYLMRTKGLLLTVGILVFAGVFFLIAVRDQQSVPNQTGAADENKNATFFIGGIHYTDIQEGVKSLELIAETADLYMDENRANLSKMQAAFTEKTGDNVFLFAESGAWEMDSNDLEVSGNVMLKTNEYEMETEMLTYTDSKRLFATQSPVSIQGGVLGLVAEGMSYSLDSKHIHLNGNEESDFGDDIGL